MQWFESVLVALQSLRANKLRSILTLVGVIIGVTTVIAVVSVISGMNRYVASTINRLGTTTFVATKYGIITSEAEWLKARGRKKLRTEDMLAVRDLCESCRRVGGRLESNRKVKYGNQSLADVEIRGTTPEVGLMTDTRLSEGRLVNTNDNEHHRRVAFIGLELKKKLFPNIDPIGRQVQISGVGYQVIGIAEEKGSFLGQNLDMFAEIPLTTFENHFGRRRSLDLFVQASSIDVMSVTQDEVRSILRARRKDNYHDDDSFAFLTSESFMSLYRNMTGTAFVAMVGIASISLVVGGIVIMNIMMVSVTERTREIGVRKAVGARRGTIMLQFLIEAVTVAGVGGVIGVLLGGGVAKILAATTPLPASIELWSVIAGLVVSSSVGLISGVWPAMKAARMDPISALRHE
jgi:putative ABC transport system permease protein